MNTTSLAKIAVTGNVTCCWCNKAPAAWFDIDKRDPPGYIAICDTCHQNPRVDRTYAIHVVDGEAIIVLPDGHGGKNTRVRVSKGTMARIEAIEVDESKKTADAAISHALDAHDNVHGKGTGHDLASRREKKAGE